MLICGTTHAWGQHSIGETCDVYTGGEAPVDVIRSKSSEGEYKYVILSNGIGENAIWGYSKEYRFNCPAITFSSIGSLGCPELRKEPFTPIIRLKVIIPKAVNNINITFLKYNLDTVDFSNNASGIPNINADSVKAIQFSSPNKSLEQIQIGQLFENLDSLLTLHQDSILCKLIQNNHHLVSSLKISFHIYNVWRSRKVTKNIIF